jgi:hypothetical protein
MIEETKNLTFRPDIEPLKQTNRKDSIKSGNCSRISAQIPEDNHETRSKFKSIKGMDKFLERQYKAMADREELKLMKYNFGKISE